MLGIIAAILFIIAFLLNAASVATSDVFTPMSLALAGLVVLFMVAAFPLAPTDKGALTMEPTDDDVQVLVEKNGERGNGKPDRSEEPCLQNP